MPRGIHHQDMIQFNQDRPVRAWLRSEIMMMVYLFCPGQGLKIAKNPNSKKVKAWTHLHFSNILTCGTWHVGATGCNGLCVQYSERVFIYVQNICWEARCVLGAAANPVLDSLARAWNLQRYGPWFMLSPVFILNSTQCSSHLRAALTWSQWWNDVTNEMVTESLKLGLNECRVDNSCDDDRHKNMTHGPHYPPPNHPLSQSSSGQQPSVNTSGTLSMKCTLSDGIRTCYGPRDSRVCPSDHSIPLTDHIMSGVTCEL